MIYLMTSNLGSSIFTNTGSKQQKSALGHCPLKNSDEKIITNSNMVVFSILVSLIYTSHIDNVAIFHRAVIFNFFSILRTYLTTVRLEPKNMKM